MHKPTDCPTTLIVFMNIYFQEYCVSCGVCTYAVYELLCISVCTCSWIPTNRSQKLTSDVRFYHFLHLLFTA